MGKMISAAIDQYHIFAAIANQQILGGDVVLMPSKPHRKHYQ